MRCYWQLVLLLLPYYLIVVPMEYLGKGEGEALLYDLSERGKEAGMTVQCFIDGDCCERPLKLWKEALSLLVPCVMLIGASILCPLSS